MIRCFEEISFLRNKNVSGRTVAIYAPKSFGLMNEEFILSDEPSLPITLCLNTSNLKMLWKIPFKNVTAETAIITQKNLSILLLSREKKSQRAKYKKMYFGILENPLRLSLEKSLRKKDINAITNRAQSNILIEDLRNFTSLEAIFFIRKRKIIQ
jgi:hypothetical protein